MVHWKATHDRFADLLDAGGVIVLPFHVVARASSQNFYLPVTAHVLRDLETEPLGPARNLGAAALDNEGYFHGSRSAAG
jgi:hypothetical protein